MALTLKNQYDDEIFVGIRNTVGMIEVYDNNENTSVIFQQLAICDIDKIIAELIEIKQKLTLVDVFNEMSTDNNILAAIGVDKFMSLFGTDQWYDTFHPTLTQSIKDKFNELTAQQNQGNVQSPEHTQ